MADSSLTRPSILVAIEVVVTALTIGFTASSSRNFRLLGLLVVTFSASLVFIAVLSHSLTTFWASVFAGNASTYVLRYFDLVVLDRWSVDSGGPARDVRDRKKSDTGDTIRPRGTKNLPVQNVRTWQRLRFGLEATLSPRQLNTPHQVKNVPPWSSSDIEYIPSRGDFLWRTTIQVLFDYMIVDLCAFAAQPEQNAVMFAADKVDFLSRLQHLSTEETTIRVFSSLALWLNIYCIFRLIHGLLSLLAVGTRISEVKDWAPPFGQLTEAHSIRRFWGYVEAGSPSRFEKSLSV